MVRAVLLAPRIAAAELQQRSHEFGSELTRDPPLLSRAAQDEAAERHPLTDMPAPGQITTGFFLPEHANKRLPAGKVVRLAGTAQLGVPCGFEPVRSHCKGQVSLLPVPVRSLDPSFDHLNQPRVPSRSLTRRPAALLQISIVLGIHNDAGEEYNVTAVMGSLNAPNDFRMHIQNFTQQVGAAALCMAGGRAT